MIYSDDIEPVSPPILNSFFFSKLFTNSNHPTSTTKKTSNDISSSSLIKNHNKNNMIKASSTTTTPTTNKNHQHQNNFDDKKNNSSSSGGSSASTFYSLLNGKSNQFKFDQQGLRSLLQQINGNDESGNNINSTNIGNNQLDDSDEFGEEMEEFDLKKKYYYKPYTTIYQVPTPQSMSRSSSLTGNSYNDLTVETGSNHFSPSTNHYSTTTVSSSKDDDQYSTGTSGINESSTYYSSSSPKTAGHSSPYFMSSDKRSGNHSPLLSFISEHPHLDDDSLLDENQLLLFTNNSISQNSNSVQPLISTSTTTTTTTTTNTTECQRCRNEMDSSNPNSESHSSPPSFSFIEYVSQQWTNISSKVSMVALNESGSNTAITNRESSLSTSNSTNNSIANGSSSNSYTSGFYRVLTLLLRLAFLPFLLSATIPFFIGVICFLIVLSVLSLSTLTAFCFLLMTTPFFIIGVVGLLYVATFIINGNVRGGHRTILVLGVSIYELLVKSIYSLTNYLLNQYRKLSKNKHHHRRR